MFCYTWDNAKQLNEPLNEHKFKQGMHPDNQDF